MAYPAGLLGGQALQQQGDLLKISGKDCQSSNECQDRKLQSERGRN